MSATDTARLREAGERRADAEVERSAAHQALADAVRAARDAGMKPSQIAAEAGVSRQTVHTILRG